MISVWWLIPVFFAGGFFGMFLMCLAYSSKCIDPDAYADRDVDKDVSERSKEIWLQSKRP